MTGFGNPGLAKLSAQKKTLTPGPDGEIAKVKKGDKHFLVRHGASVTEVEKLMKLIVFAAFKECHRILEANSYTGKQKPKPKQQKVKKDSQ